MCEILYIYIYIYIQYIHLVTSCAFFALLFKYCTVSTVQYCFAMNHENARNIKNII